MPAHKRTDVSPEQRAKLDRAAERSKEWHEKNKMRANKGSAKRYEKNKDKILAGMRDNYIKKRPQKLETMKTYRETHKKERSDYNKKRRQEDELFVIAERARGMINKLKRRKQGMRTGRTFEMIGADARKLRAHINEQLCGRNLIDCQVDHIFPPKAYKTTPNWERSFMHYSNMQPLTAKENLNKRNQLPTKAMAAKVPEWVWPEGVKFEHLPDKYVGWRNPLFM